MIVVLDMNIPRSWAPYLLVHGIEALHWREVGSARAPDTDILAWAQANVAVVVTHYSDFGELLWRSGAASPSVVHVVLERFMPERYGRLLLQVLEAVEGQAGSCVYVTLGRGEHGYKTTLLPLGGGRHGDGPL